MPKPIDPRPITAARPEMRDSVMSSLPVSDKQGGFEATDATRRGMLVEHRGKAWPCQRGSAVWRAPKHVSVRPSAYSKPRERVQQRFMSMFHFRARCRSLQTDSPYENLLFSFRTEPEPQFRTSGVSPRNSAAAERRENRDDTPR
jgi:hypothetical protein